MALRSGLGGASRDEGDHEADDHANDDVLAAALGLRLQHLLVDEMQDTSSSQYELIQMLTQGWDGYSQTVFLVGDPKQSIYLFRQARVERFLHTMRSGMLGDLPLGCLRLTANFRSQAALVTQFNDDFSEIFPALEDALHPEAVPFVAADPVRAQNLRSAGRVWHANLVPAARSNPIENTQAKQTLRRDEAFAIRGIIKQWRVKPLPPGRTEPWKIAVLVRSRGHASEIIRALQEANDGAPIPFRAIDIDALKERPEVQDLFALTRALLHPADRVAWLAVLHAPWCGFGLTELHLLTGADDPTWAERSLPDVIAERGDLLDPEACQRLERLWPILQAAAAMDARILTAQRIERTWRSLGGDTYLGATERTNARRYLQLLDAIEQQTGRVDLEQLVRQLDDLYAAPSVEANAVDILTIHKSKGLEWDLVFVPALDRIGRIDGARMLSWIELDSSSDAGEEDEDFEEHEEEQPAAHILLAPIRSRGEDSRELNAWLDGSRREREAAERKRLLYVACTRAREELHLFAAPEINEKGGISPRSGSLLQSFWPAAKAHFDAAAANALAFPAPFPDEEEEEETPALAFAAAAASTPSHSSLLYRLPLDFDPEAHLRSSRPLAFTGAENSGTTAPALFVRPEGSFAARAFGNAVHAFLELLAQELAEGQPVATLRANLSTWSPRIAAVLRAEGLPPAQVDRFAQRVLAALQNTLHDPEGAWLLGAHAESANEFALTAWSDDTDRSSIRLDRRFRAGPEPLVPGDSCLWIVDYKTATHGALNLDEFLASERDKYAPQLEAYARILSATASDTGATQQKLRLALYYPMLPKLIWWTLERA
jgi:ATP-dependent helicase/nuclease subunit A